MRRMILCVVAGLIAASFATPASGGPSNREVTKEYTMANGVIAFNSAEAHWTLGAAYHVFRTNPGEQFVTFSISDDSGLPARGHIHMDSNGDGKLDRIDDFCTETPKPINVGTAKKIELGVIFGSCPDQTPATVTRGTVTATFSK